MRVTVKFFTTLREITSKREEEMDLPNSITVEELLRLLSKKHGKRFMDYVYDDRGKVQPHLQFLVNGRSTITLQDLKTKLGDGDHIAIVPPVGGG